MSELHTVGGEKKRQASTADSQNVNVSDSKPVYSKSVDGGSQHSNGHVIRGGPRSRSHKLRVPLVIIIIVVVVVVVVEQ